MPNDPNFGPSAGGDSNFQWYLDHSTQTPGIANEDIQVECAWGRIESAKGSSAVIIAILDGGVDASHPDLAYAYSLAGWGNKVMPGGNFIGGSFVDVTDSSGHGTAMAGIAAARTNNGATTGDGYFYPRLGVSGVAGGWYSPSQPDSAGARILPVKVLDIAGDYLSYEAIALGINWAVSEGARVINCSFGDGAGRPDAVDFDVRDALFNALQAGAVCVAASGNQDAEQVIYPAGFARYGLTIAVGASDRLGRRLCSLREPHLPPGGGSTYGSHLDFIAPGYAIYTTVPRYRVPVNSYASVLFGEVLWGTSMSAAMTSGAAALLLSAMPELADVDVKSILRQTAHNSCGEDELFVGKGRLDIGSAIEAVSGFTKSLETGVATGPDSIGPIDETLIVIRSSGIPGVDDQSYAAQRREVRFQVTMPEGLAEAPLMWARVGQTVGWPNIEQTAPHYFNYGWGEVVPGSLSAQGATLRTYVYFIPELDRWVPCAPADASVEWAAIMADNYVIGNDYHDRGAPLTLRTVGNPLRGAGRDIALVTGGLGSAEVTVSIYDVAGRRIRVLASNVCEGDECRLKWDGLDASGKRVRPGVYFCSVSSGGRRSVARAVVLTLSQ